MGDAVALDENLAKDYPPVQNGILPDISIKLLQLQGAFSLPPPSIRNSLIDSFMAVCSPWMPIVDRLSLESSSTSMETSLLLLQAVFLAGSRVSSAPLTYVPSEELYGRAKALFFSGYEKNTLVMITASVLMQLWNPSGPEHVSLDTSSFWLRTGVGLAFQVGLHREPKTGSADASLRRRLWWTLWVSCP